MVCSCHFHNAVLILLLKTWVNANSWQSIAKFASAMPSMYVHVQFLSIRLPTQLQILYRYMCLNVCLDWIKIQKNRSNKQTKKSSFSFSFCSLTMLQCTMLHWTLYIEHYAVYTWYYIVVPSHTPTHSNILKLNWFHQKQIESFTRNL